ncbi:MAG: hypothetical protein ILP09_05375 [Oscillospiraceae bacterium]|nr:hypothetical protein [Oscillospiraceae bacterium]
MSKKKKQNMNPARNMDIDAWRKRKITERTERFFAERDDRFAETHAGDSDGSLFLYLAAKAREMRRMPHPVEIEGGRYIHSRLGDWDALADRLGYPPVRRHATDCRIYRKEYKRQEDLFYAERRRLRAEKEAAKSERRHQKNAEQRARQEANRAKIRPARDAEAGSSAGIPRRQTPGQPGTGTKEDAKKDGPCRSA